MTIVIVFKTGYQLKVKCEDCIVTRDGLGTVTNISFDDVTENKLIYSKLDDVLCVYRVVSDEEISS